MYNYSHGGDIYSPGVSDILDFSANINPFGIPDGVKNVLVNAASRCDIYPDPYCTQLRQAIAGQEGVLPETIFCGGGAAEIIFRLVIALKPKKALLAVPSFTEYEEALRTISCEINYFHMKQEEDFKLSYSFIDCLTPDIDMIFLCNPNNPTGHRIDQKLMDDIIAECEKKNIIAVIDECFIDFLDDKMEDTILNAIEKHKNLVVLKAFTKLFAMAGVRLGYCCTTNENIIEKLYHSGQPWSVSYFAQQGGIAATQEKEYVQKTLAIIKAERERLKAVLVKLGYTVYDSKANFIFFKVNSNIDLKAILFEDKILIRSCENYIGLTRGYYRIAVKRPEENDILINTLIKRNEL